jgi:hypothetical protein
MQGMQWAEMVEAKQKRLSVWPQRNGTKQGGCSDEGTTRGGTGDSGSGSGR